MAAQIFKITVPMLLAFLLGLLLKRAPFNASINGLVRTFSASVRRIFLPLIIFHAFFTVNFKAEYLACSVAFFLVMLASFCVGFLLLKLFSKANSAFPFIMASYEGGLLGYPLSSILYPAFGASYFVFFDMGQMIFSYFVFIPVMQIVTSKRANVNGLMKSVLLNPILDAMIVGLIAGRLGLNRLLLVSSFGPAYFSGISIISTVMTYGLLFTIGFDFLITNKSSAQCVLSAACRTATLLVAGVIASLMLHRFIPYQKPFLLVMLLGCILPSPLCLTAVNDFKENAAYINTVIPYSTLITFLLFPVLVCLSLTS